MRDFLRKRTPGALFPEDVWRKKGSVKFLRIKGANGKRAFGPPGSPGFPWREEGGGPFFQNLGLGPRIPLETAPLLWTGVLWDGLALFPPFRVGPPGLPPGILGGFPGPGWKTRENGGPGTGGNFGVWAASRVPRAGEACWWEKGRVFWGWGPGGGNSRKGGLGFGDTPGVSRGPFPNFTPLSRGALCLLETRVEEAGSLQLPHFSPAGGIFLNFFSQWVPR